MNHLRVLPATGEAVRAKPAVAAWLTGVCGLIVLMVVVGGITRLTGSGLSITDWKPIMGAIPPLNSAEWEEAFRKYREIPQFQLHLTMGLSDFKQIFFWEYAHRLLGRLVGVAFLFPWLYFVWRKTLNRKLAIRLGFGFVLGGLQGLLGWFMVMSGLADRVSVSHYRLAAHLGLALIVLGYLFWILLDLGHERDSQEPSPAANRLSLPLVALTALLGLQIIYGALVAGLKAGFGYNTFPTMNGDWFPLGFFQVEPAWLNIFESRAGVQFIHRMIGWSLLLSIAALWARSRSLQLTAHQHGAIRALLLMALVQFTLGALTVVLMVPLPLAAAHQLGACFLLLIALRANHALRRNL